MQWVSTRDERTVEALKGGVYDALKLIRASVARARVTAVACSSCVRPSSSASSLSSSLSSFAITDVIIRQGSRAMAAGRHTAVLIQDGRGRQRLANSTVTYSINRASARHFLTGCRPNENNFSCDQNNRSSSRLGLSVCLSVSVCVRTIFF